MIFVIKIEIASVQVSAFKGIQDRITGLSYRLIDLFLWSVFGNTSDPLDRFIYPYLALMINY